jgi:hypothetical protein
MSLLINQPTGASLCTPAYNFSMRSQGPARLGRKLLIPRTPNSQNPVLQKLLVRGY